MGIKQLPERGRAAGFIDLPERLRLFVFSDSDLATGRTMWSIMEPEAEAIAQIHASCWRKCASAGLSGDSHRGIEALGISYLHDRYTATHLPAWIMAAENAVAVAFENDVPLTTILSATSAGASLTLEILGRRHECSKEERQLINDVFTRLRSLECDIIASLYTAYMDFDARWQRDQVARGFEEGISLTISAATGESGALRRRASDTSAAALGMRGRASEVAVMAEQSAVAMREAAYVAAGLIAAIEQARFEVESSAGVTAQAADLSIRAVVVADDLSGHAKAIESILALIRDVAGQTNLLALNATIEAARAGDAGRGFAVVAQEVKSLANQTARATDDIAAKIAAIQSASRQTLDVNAAIRDIVGEVSASAKRIRSAMEAQAQTVSTITSAIDETAFATDSVSGTIAAIREDTETIATEIDLVSRGFDNLDDRLCSLGDRAASFAKRVAA